jgi:hypothetical protein
LFTAQRTEGVPARRPAIHHNEIHAAPPGAKSDLVSGEEARR